VPRLPVRPRETRTRPHSRLDAAKKFVGTPYVWGGSSPLGFDCSGFTQFVFRQFGVNLPRMSNQQGFGGSAVNYADAKPGDLIFWDNSTRNNGADHVGIYLGNGMLISAPKPGDHVKIQAVYGKPFFRRYL
jgi:cell wall-associated NlpC family hydrolase